MTAASMPGSEPNEFNRFGWVVEIDPYDPGSTPVKHTALGRIRPRGRHGRAGARRARGGLHGRRRPERVRLQVRQPRRLQPGQPRRQLHAARQRARCTRRRFNSDGSGSGCELTQGVNGLDAASGFPSQAEVVIYARLAADRVGRHQDGPPRMGRPCTRRRGRSTSPDQQHHARDRTGHALDAANPRANNVFGHIVRWNETGVDAAASTFRWNIFVLAGDPRQRRPPPSAATSRATRSARPTASGSTTAACSGSRPTSRPAPSTPATTRTSATT